MAGYQPGVVGSGAIAQARRKRLDAAIDGPAPVTPKKDPRSSAKPAAPQTMWDVFRRMSGKRRD